MPKQYPEQAAGAGTRISIPVPAPDADLFRHKATDDLLHFLADNPDEAFGIRSLSRLTGHSTHAVKSAADVLEANGLVTSSREGTRRPIRIDRTALERPDDPVLRIPQREFHEPVRAALARLRETFDGLEGVLVHGSVARGEADRRSDIDLWVLADDGGRQQHRANELAKELGEERFNTAGAAQGRDGRHANEGRGDRYEFHILVESPDSAHGYADRLGEIFTEAITLEDSATVREVRREVLDGD